MTPKGENRRWLVNKSALVRLGTARQSTNERAESIADSYTSPRSPCLRSASLPEPPRSIVRRCGQHRAPSAPDLLIAATAELAGLIVLHLDKDFDLIAAITGQRLERLELT